MHKTCISFLRRHSHIQAEQEEEVRPASHQLGAIIPS